MADMVKEEAAKQRMSVAMFLKKAAKEYLGQVRGDETRKLLDSVAVEEGIVHEGWGADPEERPLIKKVREIGKQLKGRN